MQVQPPSALVLDSHLGHLKPSHLPFQHYWAKYILEVLPKTCYIYLQPRHILQWTTKTSHELETSRTAAGTRGGYTNLYRIFTIMLCWLSYCMEGRWYRFSNYELHFSYGQYFTISMEPWVHFQRHLQLVSEGTAFMSGHRTFRKRKSSPFSRGWHGGRMPGQWLDYTDG